ncbi:MAG: HDIG domain-containing protein [Acidobacteriota bacterium]|jgi:putative nucleotidyltransferase with HDIG domain
MSSTTRRLRRGRRVARARARAALGYDPIWTVLAILAIVIIMAPQIRFAQPDYQPGDIATADVTAPVDLNVPDPVSTDRRRAEATRRVPDVYDYVPEADAYGKQVVQSFFAWGRSARMEDGPEGAATDVEPDAGVWEALPDDARDEIAQEAMAAVGRPLPDELIAALWDEPDGFSIDTELAVAGTLITLSDERLIGTIERTRLDATSTILLRDVETQEERRLPDSDSVLEIGEARELAQSMVAERLGLSEAAETALGEFVAALVAPNLRFNSNASLQRQREEEAAVQPAFYEVKRGRVLLRQGDEVTAQKIRELQALQDQYRTDRSLVGIAGTLLLVALAVFSLWRYVVHYKRRMRYQRVHHLYLLALVTLVGMVLLTRVSLFIGAAVADAAAREPFTTVDSYHYAIPFASGAVLLLLLVDAQVAWAFSAVFAVVLGIMTQDLGMMMYALFGSFAAVYGMSQYKQRTALTRNGFLVGGVNAVAVLGLALLAAPIESLPGLGFQVVCALAGGFLVSIVATIALPPLEHLFGSLTDIKLLELSNMNLPLLRELAVSAPGTYHHSVVVGTLAENAAEAIGVNPLFARVAAYYHDIGKLRQPQYFVENQKDGNNPHDNLSPNMSALVLVSHVKDGVAYAQEHGLPQPLIDAIPQHHGTRLIRYFYEKARSSAQEEGREISESDFRYPGPRPRSKETAILMLADGVEAISRTLSDTSPQRLRAMIKRAIQEVVDDDQLSECALTLEDLSKIADAFLGVLAGMHHQRIEYPEASNAPKPGPRVSLSDEDRGSQLSDQTYH